MARKFPSPAERLHSRLVVNPTNGCLEYTGSRDPRGYGGIYVNGQNVKAHRLAYILAHGSVPAGLQIDHLCRNPRCCNPDHLEAVTQRTNVLRGVGHAARNAAKTHCPKGHPYDGENAFLDGRGRRCRLCTNARVRAAYARAKHGKE